MASWNPDTVLDSMHPQYLPVESTDTPLLFDMMLHHAASLSGLTLPQMFRDLVWGNGTVNDAALSLSISPLRELAEELAELLRGLGWREVVLRGQPGIRRWFSADVCIETWLAEQTALAEADELALENHTYY